MSCVKRTNCIQSTKCFGKMSKNWWFWNAVQSILLKRAKKKETTQKGKKEQQRKNNDMTNKSKKKKNKSFFLFLSGDNFLFFFVSRLQLFLSFFFFSNISQSLSTSLVLFVYTKMFHGTFFRLFSKADFYKRMFSIFFNHTRCRVLV